MNSACTKLAAACPVLAVIAALTAGTPASAQQVFYPSGDTCQALNDCVSRNGSSTYMQVRNRYGGGGSATWEVDAMMKFDLSSIPWGTAVTRARLYLYYYYWWDNNPAGRTLNLHRFQGDWSEGTLNWCNLPAHASAVSASSSVPAAYGWMSWDVTADVQAFVSGSTANYGWFLTDPVPWNNYNIPIIYFYSKENSSNKPYLEVVTGSATSSVRAAQQSGTKLVNITYDARAGDSSLLNVTVAVSTNNGTSYNLPAASFSGSGYGASVTPGNNRQIVWNAGADWNNQQSSQVRFRVTASGGGTSSSADSPSVTVDTRDTGNRPVVQSVSSPYCQWNQHAYFLNGVSVNQTFTVVPDWNGKTPGSIKFIGPWGTDTQSGTQTTRTYNVGADFGVGGALTVVLVASDGAESLAYRVNFDVINPPPLIAAANLLFLQGKYGIQISSEWPMLNEGTSSVPDDDSGQEMPGCTGKPLLFNAELSYSGEISLDGTWNASLSLAADNEDWNLLGVGVKPRVYGGVEGEFRNDGWSIGGLGGIGVELSYDSPPFYFWYLPPIYGKWAMSLDQAIEGHLAYDSVKGLSLNGEFPGQLELEGALGAGLDGITDVEVFIGGGPYWVFQWPAEPRLEDWGITLHGGIRWLVLLWKDEVSFERSWSADGKLSQALLAPLAQTALKFPPLSEFTLLPRDYRSNSTPYGTFLPAKSVKPKAWEDPVAVGVPLPLQTSIWPYSQPALAVSGANRLLLFLTDNPARSAENRTELLWSEWDGSAWSDPAAVWDDATADFAPSVQLFPAGSALAVWPNEKMELPDGATLDDALAGLEITAATFDPSSGVWTPVNLTDNEYLDRSPQLAAGANGTALLTWISNPGNSLLGATNAPNIIQSRLWDGSSWQEVGPIATDAGMLLWSTVAYDGMNGVFLATIDPDDDPSTTDDQELWGATFNGANWSTFARLTTNAVQDTKPQAVFGSGGQLLVVWYQNTNLVMRVGDLNLDDPTVVGQLSGALSQKDFHLVTGPAGQISLVWEDLAADGSGPDPRLLNYDAALGVWSAPLRLLNNTNLLERSFSGAYDPDGSLLLAYNQVAVSYDTGQVPQFGQVDLMFLEYPIGGDLGLSAGDLSFSTNNPAPGQTVTISAVVHNWGEKAATDVQAVFCDGDPSASGMMIGATQTVAGVLAAGSNATVQVSWLVPQTASNRTVYVVVDPALLLEDRNRANNTASQAVIAPDLQISDITVLQPSPTNRVINARVVNLGTIPTGQSVDVEFRRWATNGPVLATIPIGNLAAGGQYDASFEWNMAGVVFTNAFETVYATADPANVVAELDKANNVRSVQVMTALDSDNDGLLDGEEAHYGTNPYLADTDGDGLSDGDEVHIYHTDPTRWDTDGDGMSDGQEVLAGTDPNDPSSVFKISSVLRNADGSVTLQWLSVTNKLYRVNRSLTPARTSFTTVTNGVPGTPPVNTFTDTTATNTAAFYWVEHQ